jgi:hypothetical protein
MKKELITAIISAVDLYIQQEEDGGILYDDTPSVQGGGSITIKNSVKSNWKMFGQQDQLRARTNRRVKKGS